MIHDSTNKHSMTLKLTNNLNLYVTNGKALCLLLYGYFTLFALCSALMVLMQLSIQIHP